MLTFTKDNSTTELAIDGNYLLMVTLSIQKRRWK